MNPKKRSILLAIVFLPAYVFAGPYSSGTGEPNDPYLIATAEDMNEIGAHPNDWDAHFLLVADINLADYTGTEFNIIGNDSNAFTGVFDGNRHKIFNFSYSTPGASRIGLFGVILGADAIIKDLGLIDPNFDGGTGVFQGALAGWLTNGTIHGCYVENGSVSGGDSVGGLIGNNRLGTISNCWSTSDVSAINVAGGLAGFNSDGIVSSCYAMCDILGITQLGGLVGGASGGEIIYCYTKCNVSGDAQVGGLVGGNGFCIIENCYSTGSVFGNQIVGGLVGSNEGTISKCYSVVDVSGSWWVGGLAGDNETGVITISFWDIETSGQSGSAGGQGKTTAGMKTRSTFTDAGWDFIEIWNIGENQTYPFLRTHPAGDINHDGIVNFYDFAIIAGRWLEETP